MVDDVTRRGFLRTTGGAAAAATIAGCLDDDAEIDETDDEFDDDDDTSDVTDDDETDGGSEFDDTLRLINSTMDSFDPVKTLLGPAGEVIIQMMETPVQHRNGEVDTVENLLVEDYELSDDFLTYTFHFKEGVQFHDGYGELTADDVVYSWERLGSAENTRRSNYLFDNLGVAHETTTVETEDGDEIEEYEPWTMAVEAVDEYAVELTLDSPNHVALDILASRTFAVIPEGLLGDVEGYDGEMDHNVFESENPIGTGPFQFEYWDPEQEVEVSAFDDYHGDGPHVSGVHWQVIEDANAMYNYAMNENVDIIEMSAAQFEPENVEIEEEDELGREIGTYGPMRNGRTANYMRTASLSTDLYIFNTDSVDRAARRATAHVLDLAQVSQDIWKGRSVPAHFMTPMTVFPGGVGEYDRLAEEYPYGPGSQIDAAREVMEEAGYGEDDQYEFTLTILDDDPSRSLANLVRDQLAAAHVNLQIETAPLSTLVERMFSGTHDAVHVSWGMAWPDPSNILQLAYPPNTDIEDPGVVVGANWADTDAAERAEEAWHRIQDHQRPTDEDAAERTEGFLQMERAVWEDVPLLPIRYLNQERLWYDWLDIPLIGSRGGQRYDQARLSERE